MNWYIAVIKKYVDFSGRARRKEYWLFTLFNTLFWILCIYIDFTLGGGSTEIMSSTLPVDGGVESLTMAESTGFSGGAITGIYALATLLPSLGVLFRRLHDTGRSGWWWLISMIPIVGGIVLLVFLVEDSQANTNQYGANPKTA